MALFAYKGMLWFMIWKILVEPSHWRRQDFQCVPKFDEYIMLQGNIPRSAPLGVCPTCVGVGTVHPLSLSRQTYSINQELRHRCNLIVNGLVDSHVPSWLSIPCACAYMHPLTIYVYQFLAWNKMGNSLMGHSLLGQALIIEFSIRHA